MSRDFILVFGGGMVSLITTLVVLFIADYIYRREQGRTSSTSELAASDGASDLTLPEKLTTESVNSSEEQVQSSG